ncbi:PilZ domain-containing protein [Dokdonella sp.]|uniref:PilZ domain-containing protein n=1 Tax=Dokdonella sp. TaxID=2291710 RepID=UPI00260DDE42|nr:PilZ domain-containing protein [Dokdonella sp.]
MIDKRRLLRKRPDVPLRVTDAMTGRVIGQIGNLSLDGLMLLSDVEIVADALYQFAFDLPDEYGRPRPVEVGVHESWTDATQTPGRWWAGFRFIDIGEADERILRSWLGHPTGD